MENEYPFFTSGSEILSHSSYLVDGGNLFINTGGKFDFKFYYGKASYSTDTLCLKPKLDMLSYLYLTLLSNKEYISNCCFKGSALKHLDKDSFKKIEIYYPSENERKYFLDRIGHVFLLIDKYKKELTLLNEYKLLLIKSLY